MWGLTPPGSAGERLSPAVWTRQALLSVDGRFYLFDIGDGCTGDGPSFKGAYVRGLGTLGRALADRPYAAPLTRWADSAHDRDRNVLGPYGPYWNGGGTTDYGCRQSALDLLNAATGRPGRPWPCGRVGACRPTRPCRTTWRPSG